MCRLANWTCIVSGGRSEWINRVGFDAADAHQILPRLDIHPSRTAAVAERLAARNQLLLAISINMATSRSMLIGIELQATDLSETILPYLLHTLYSMGRVAAKAQQAPHEPWFLIAGMQYIFDISNCPETSSTP